MTDNIKEVLPSSSGEEKTEEEKSLEQLALDELLREAQKGAVLASEYGSMSWSKPKAAPKTQKRFLCNTLRDTVQANRRKDSKSNRRRDRSRSRSPKRRSDPEKRSHDEKRSSSDNNQRQ